MNEPTAHTTIRALNPQDLDAVVAIDAAAEGRSRRSYFQRRLDAARAQPAQHVQLAAVDSAGLAGCMLARRTSGEFGRSRPGLRLEVIGVRNDRRGQGVARQLLQAMADNALRHGASELRTTAASTNRLVLPWLQAMGFERTNDQVLDCAVGSVAARAGAAAQAVVDAGASEIDYGSPEANDFERASKTAVDVQAMRTEDLGPICRIDRQLTGNDRREYMAEKLGEALRDSAIRVSLTAWLDGAIVGFLMARTDLGDFGRTEPVAVLDTIGVDPDYAHRGVGRALLAQLMSDLRALHVERVETVVGPNDVALQGFLRDTGFAPSQRLSFVRALRA